MLFLRTDDVCGFLKGFQEPLKASTLRKLQ